MNIFEKASRVSLRFPSNKGLLAAEQLWGIPLQSKNGFDLDSIAKSVNSVLKTGAETSFVSTASSPAQDEAQLQMDILKYVIADRLAENEAARGAAARKAERERLVGILGDKQEEDLRKLSADELAARIAKLT